MKRFYSIIIALAMFVAAGSLDRNRGLEAGEVEQADTTVGFVFESERIYSPNDCVEVAYPHYKSDYGYGGEINSIIEGSIIEYVSSRIENAKNYDFRMSCEVMKETDEILSLLFTGTLVIEYAVHPNYAFFTVNIALPEMRRMRLSDMIEIDDQLVEKILVGEQVEDVSPLGRKEATREFLRDAIASTELLIEELQNADSSNEWYSYLCNDHVGIVIPIPYAIGGFSQFELTTKSK